ncbi:MAG: tRNA (guanosine(37)-N1)-methyltransferase TrmD [Peptostreptococcales bacterium]
MRIDILTLFPEMMECVLKTSIMGRALEKGIVDIQIINIRDYSQDKHRSVDDYPFGGGNGMVMQAQPVFDALRDIDAYNKKIIYLTPKGKQFHQETAIELSQEERIVLICGHYEGIDQRIIDYWVTDEISIGDYVLTGGEIPALAVIDSVCRMIPGVLSSEDCYKNESIYSGLLEYPQYTRPREFEGLEVPDVLVSGNHQKIDEWRLEQSLELTKKRRKDLYNKYMESKKNI